MNIGIDVDGCITDLESWFYFNEQQRLKSKTLLPTNITYVIYAIFSKPRENAINVLHKLYKDNKIFIITAREYGTEESVKGIISRTLLKHWIRRHGIKFHKIIFCSDSEKIKYCKKHNIDVMIEDNPNNITNLKKANINIIPFDTSYNSGFTSWIEIYKQIQIIKKERK